MRRELAVRQAIATALALFALLAVIAKCTGCDRALLAADAASYERELDGCLVEARDAGRSLAVYERCAHEADIRHGVDAGRD